MKGIGRILKETDWLPLVFIMALIYLKLPAKCCAIAGGLLLVAVSKDRHWQKPSRPVISFLLLILCGLIGAGMAGLFKEDRYVWCFGYAALLWLIAGAGSYLTQILIPKDKKRIAPTIKTFFIVNAIVSLMQLVKVMLASHTIMPYWLEDPNITFGISTGDFITGISGWGAMTNASIGLFGVLYFLYKQELRMSLLCGITMLLCCSNLVIIIALSTLLMIAISSRPRRLSLLLLILFPIIYAILSPKNVVYVWQTLTRKDNKKTNLTPLEGSMWEKGNLAARDSLILKNIRATDERLGYTRFSSCAIPIPMHLGKDFADSIANTAIYKRQGEIADTTLIRAAIANWYKRDVEQSLPKYAEGRIKLLALKQTLAYCISNPRRLLLGSGPGDFSSKTALKASSLGLDGHYPKSKAWVGHDYFLYHFHDVLYVYSQPPVKHTILNFPNSSYHQLLGEYGITGLLIFLLGYAWYFWRMKAVPVRFRLPALCVLMILLGTDYFLEMVCITVIFEWLVRSVCAEEENSVAI